MNTIGIILVMILFVVSNFGSLVLGFVSGERNGIKSVKDYNKNVDFSKCISKIDSCVRTNQEIEKMIARLIQLSNRK